MEVIEVIVDGQTKFEVLFNGAPQSCFHDTDCPGAGICAVNQSWAVNIGGWCMCNTQLGVGDSVNCDQPCQSYGVGLLIIYLLVWSAALVNTVWGFYLLFQYVRYAWGKVSKPVLLALGFAIVGSLFCGIGTILLAEKSIAFPSHFVLLPDPKTSRIQKISDSSINLPLQGCFAVGTVIGYCSAIILPLTWIDLAQRSLRLRQRAVIAVNFISITLTFVILCIQLPFYLFAATNYQNMGGFYFRAAVAVNYFIVAVLVFSNLIAIWKMKSFQKFAMTQTTVDDKTQEIKKGNQIQNAITRISVTAGLLVFNGVLVLALLGYSNARPVTTTFVTQYSEPRCLTDPYTVAFRLQVFFVLLIYSTVLWFLSVVIRNRVATFKNLISTKTKSKEEDLERNHVVAIYSKGDGPQSSRGLKVDSEIPESS